MSDADNAAAVPSEGWVVLIVIVQIGRWGKPKLFAQSVCILNVKEEARRCGSGTGRRSIGWMLKYVVAA